jgi:hypothetical protein
MTGFIGTSLQLQSIITAQYQWLSKTSPIPYWTTCLLFYCDESLVTSWTLLRLRMKNLSPIEISWTDLTSRRPEYISPSQTVRSFSYYLFCPLLRNVQPATKQRKSYCWVRYLENVFTEAVCGSGLFRLSGVMSQYSSTLILRKYIYLYGTESSLEAGLSVRQGNVRRMCSP